MGSRAGALLLVPAIAWAIDPDYERLGWRMTAMILGVVMLVAAGPISMFLRNDPQSHGLLPDGDRAAAPPPVQTARPGQETARSQESSMTAAQAIRTPAFWLIAFGHGFTSMVILAIMTHLGLLMEDKGFAVVYTGWVVAAYTGVAMVFQLVGGYAGDRMSKRVALAFFTTLQAAGVLVLVIADTLPGFFAFAVLFGMGFGGRNPADRGHTRRLLRHGFLRQDSGAVHGADERAAADCRTLRRLDVRHAGRLR